MSFARASRRSAAAASDEPPPMPAATGRRFSSRKAPTTSPGTRSKRACGAQYKIVIRIAGGRGRRAVDFEGQPWTGRQRQRIARAGKGDKTFERVIAIRAATENLQRQVDFRRGARRELPGENST
jgi:hypothetical protein